MKTLFTDSGDFQYTYNNSNETLLYDDIGRELITFSGKLNDMELESLIEKMF